METKIAIERRAMVVAKAWCERRGWTAVTNVSETSAWDLEATDGVGQTRFIEVKGTTGGPDSVEVTKREVYWARRHGGHHAIAIVHGIEVTATAGRPVAGSGTALVYDPWDPQRAELISHRYTWQPSARATAVMRR